ncbi:MAG: S41 family peptidase [Desulfobacteraceae bacterium]|nr:S41 family peptidase [Desulfobacteraceae bacterium]
MRHSSARPRIWIAMLIGALLWTAASGVLHDLHAEGEGIYQGLKTFTDVLEIIEKNYVDEVDSKELIEKAIDGMVSGLDPHSALLPPEAYEDLKIDTRGEFTGIGISISLRDDMITVVAPIEGTPAYAAGVKAGDRIVAVDGKATRDLREAVKMMRGPKGTHVTVTIVREGVPDPIDFDLVRDVIPIQSVHSLLLKPGYGYVWVTHFRDQTVDDLQKALATLDTADAPLKGLVLDMRDNPGGLLPQAIQLADLFLERGNILSIRGRIKRHTKSFDAHPDADPPRYPIVVLINGGSASASEIVAGALQDHHRALILGTTSFGKGSVQTVENLGDGYGLKLTIARYYTPSGRSIQAKGIEPDIVVQPLTPEEAAAAEFEDRHISEKDLRNHLDAEGLEESSTPELAPDETSPRQDGDLEDDSPKPRRRHPRGGPRPPGPLTAERLLKDNQVARALDILTGYELLTRQRK